PPRRGRGAGPALPPRSRPPPAGPGAAPGGACGSRPAAPGPRTSWPPGTGSAPRLSPPGQRQTVPAIKEGPPRARGTPGHPARPPGRRYPQNPQTKPANGQPDLASPRRRRDESSTPDTRPLGDWSQPVIQDFGITTIIAIFAGKGAVVRTLRTRWRALAAGAGTAALTALGLVSLGSPPALALVTQANPFPVGNYLNYDNSDFENGVGNWAPDSSQTNNISTFTTDTTSMLHAHALEVVAASNASAATMIYKLGNGSTNAVQIGLAATGGKVRVGAYFKGPASGNVHDIEFDLGCYTARNVWLGWQPRTQVALNTSRTWQYVEEEIALPSTCAQVQGSPRVEATNFNANGILHMDDVIFAPYRAALAIGGHGDECNTGGCPSSYSNDGADWYDSSKSIGPFQTDKEFNGSLPTTSSGPNGGGDETQAGSTNSSAWPECIITYNSPVTGPQAQAQMNTFLHSVPPQQEIVLVWAQEPQGSGKTYNYCNTSGADAFVCENKQQGAYVHNSPYDTPNVLYAQDDAGSWHLNNTSCQWITPASATGAGVDLYLVDHYENNQVT